MKRQLLIFILALLTLAGFSQKKSMLAPYEESPFFPQVKLLLPGNVTFTPKNLSKNKPVMLMLFNPSCEHCQHETEQIVRNIDKFSNAEIVMSTSMPYDSMMAFRERYKLAQFNNIIVGQDIQYFLPPFFRISSLPFMAFYTKKGRLISASGGTMKIDEAVAELQKPAK